MDDEFEMQFADELDALDDAISDYKSRPCPKGKKSLDFSTPSTKRNIRQYRSKFCDDGNFCEPLNTTVEGSIPSVSMKSIKRKNSAQDLECVSETKENVTEEARQIKKAKLSVDRNQPCIPDAIDVISEDQKIINLTMSDDDQENHQILTSISSIYYMPVTDNTGRRFRLKLKNDALQKVDNFKSSLSSHLLSLPMRELKRKLEDKKYQTSLQESRILGQCFNSENCLFRPDVENLEKSLSEEEKNVNKCENLLDSLWVDRYSPRRYTDLLSDEATNRVVLRWLKLWDSVVFGKEKKSIDTNESKMNKQNVVMFNKHHKETNFELDQYDRPHFKAVLLSGPPGLGKTTLAHIISKHAGYNIVEINASDDRSAEVFKQKIDAATQMKSVLGADPKPNCLIIDEIDGAPTAAVNILLALLKQSEHLSSTKRKKRPQILMRPIICICNDLYVPALRQLRQNSFVVSFPPTVSTQLAGRLLEICRTENLLCDLTTLLALCEKADNDIRSCLNTLQFIKSRCSEVSLQAITSVKLGQKDAHKSLFSAWQHIFKMPKAKRKNYINPYERTSDNQQDLDTAAAETNTSLAARFESALDVTTASGEIEKLLQGLFENYLESKIKDPRLQCVVKGIEWLQFVDLINKDILHNQNYALMKYTNYLPVMYHLLFAVNHPQRILYPLSQFENVAKLQKSENLISTLINDVCPSVRKNLNVTAVVTEFVHLLLDIIQPTLRPVNTQLYSSREKEELFHLIKVMIAYNLSYRQERTLDGQYLYVLEPNIESLAKYPEMKSKRQLTYAAKQLISREIELEIMRRSEERENQNRQILESNYHSQKINNCSEANVKGTTESDKPRIPNYKRQTLDVKLIKEEKEYVDFFGRKVKRTAPKEKQENRKEETIGDEVWFKFKEGFSSAVRRNVKLQDLL